MAGFPLISVAMATYNGTDFIREQLDSIERQQYPNIELVISDDASTDGTWDYLVGYAARSKLEVSLHRNEANLGYVRNFEKALGLCKGDFITLCDQDDVWSPMKVQRLYQAIGMADLVHSDARLIDRSGVVLEASFTRSVKEGTRNASFCDFLFENDVTGCTAMITRRLLEKCLPFPENTTAHDWWISTVASVGAGVAYCDEALVDYRQHGNNQISANMGGKRRFVERIGNSAKKARAVRNMSSRYVRQYDSWMRWEGFDEAQRDSISSMSEFFALPNSGRNPGAALKRTCSIMGAVSPGKRAKVLRKGLFFYAVSLFRNSNE